MSRQSLLLSCASWQQTLSSPHPWKFSGAGAWGEEIRPGYGGNCSCRPAPRLTWEAAIAQLLMAEAVLDDVEGMLDHGAPVRAPGRPAPLYSAALAAAPR